MTHLLNESRSVGDQHQINHNKLVALALKAVRDSSPYRNLFAVSNRAPVDQIAGRVNPRPELVVAHQDLICQGEQRERVRDWLTASVDLQLLIEVGQDGCIRKAQCFGYRSQNSARNQQLSAMELASLR